MPTKPLLPLLRLCVLRLLELRLGLRFAVEPLERFAPLLERAEAPRDDPLRADPPRDALALAPDELARVVLFDAAPLDPELFDAELFDADAFDDPLLRCLLLDAFFAANAPSLFARGHTCD